MVLPSCCKQRIGAFCHQNCRFLATYIPAHPAKPVPMVHASAYVPPRSGRVVKTGGYPGVNLPRRIPWPVRRPSLCLRLWNPIAVRSRPKLTHRNVHERTQTRAMTRGDRGVQSIGVAKHSPCIRCAFPPAKLRIRHAFASVMQRKDLAFAMHSPSRCSAGTMGTVQCRGAGTIPLLQAWPWLG